MKKLNISIYMSINIIYLDIWDGINVIDEYSFNKKSENIYNKIRDIVRWYDINYQIEISDNIGLNY